MSARVDTLITNGRVVTPLGVIKANVALTDGRVGAILEHGMQMAAESVIDATGCLVLPGGVDPHVHFENPSMGTATAHDFALGSQAAALGGTTTFIDFAFQQPGETPLDTLRQRRASAEAKSILDFGLHGCITNPSAESVAQIPKMASMGYPSLKVFLVYRDEGWMVDDGALAEIMTVAARAGVVLLVHAENEAMLQRGIEGRVQAGDLAAGGHGRSRPPLVEAEAINRAAYLAGITGCSTYIVHVSTGDGVEVIRAAHARGAPVVGETCPHYLVFDESYLERPDGYRWVMSPPLRDATNPPRLWAALEAGELVATGSDDAAYFEAAKVRGRGDFRQIANGVPGVQVRLPILFSEGVVKRGMSLQRFVELTASTPARIFGLYPRKGVLAPGSDGDVVVLDPEVRWRGDRAHLWTNIEYTCYEEVEFTGLPIHVWSGGRPVVRDAALAADPGTGRFVARDRHDPSTVRIQ